jgi:hypothetical protein
MIILVPSFDKDSVNSLESARNVIGVPGTAIHS